MYSTNAYYNPKANHSRTFYGTFQMKNIVHERKAMSLSEPNFHSISYKGGPVDNVFYYLYVEIVYDLMSRVQYTTLEHILNKQSCSTIQFQEGYHQTGGKIKPFMKTVYIIIIIIYYI